MGFHDRPGREAKKKPKDKSAPKLQPLMDPPQQAELIRKDRKPRHTSSESEDN
jgi:hypothetical protein